MIEKIEKVTLQKKPPLLQIFCSQILESVWVTITRKVLRTYSPSLIHLCKNFKGHCFFIFLSSSIWISMSTTLMSYFSAPDSYIVILSIFYIFGKSQPDKTSQVLEIEIFSHVQSYTPNYFEFSVITSLVSICTTKFSQANSEYDHYFQ